MAASSDRKSALAEPELRGPPWDDNPARLLNREVSRLDFNERVLALAESESQPLVERLKFLAILGQNLDEFFQIRVAGLKQQEASGLSRSSPDGLTPRQQLNAIHRRVAELMGRAARVFSEELSPELVAAGISLIDWEELDDGERSELGTVFESRILPVLTPLAVDPAHPFPYISDLSLNLAVTVRDPESSEQRFARVKVPPLLARFQRISGTKRYIPVEQVIAAHLDLLFPGMEIEACHFFRVTRDADIELEAEGTDDLLSRLRSELQRRRRSPEVVRLEINPTLPRPTQLLLRRELNLKPRDVYLVDGVLDLASLWSLVGLVRPSVRATPWSGVTQPRLAAARDDGTGSDLFAVLREGDVLVHHPYDSFGTSVAAFLEQAAGDPAVLAIKQTLYRTSDEESPIVRALVRAAQAGKQAVALVELQARGNEEANIAWARLLEQAGVHVVYGVVRLKTHAKIALVVREEGTAIRRYCHVGTGNYNPTTAQIYEDLGLLTADPDLTADVADLFNYLTGHSLQRSYRRVLVAPLTLRASLLDLIREEAATADGRIVIKVNNLVDPEIADALYDASQAGTEIDLIVRSICCLRPGVPGLSESIRVRSIVGRYLEHSRIFRFGSDERGPRYYLGSADLMQRNLDRRVECLAPVRDPSLVERLAHILALNLSDDTLAWELRSDTWSKVETQLGHDTQLRLQVLAEQRSAGVR
jgi:polyphosphate kinase